jgi:Ca2+/Na+ antiporter
MNIIIGLFALVVLIIFIHPSMLINIYSTLLGRVALIFVVLFFAMNNVTLGLLAALIMIIASNMYLREGLDNMDNTTVETDANVDHPVAIAKAIQAKKDANATTSMTTEETQVPTDGVDLETIKNSIQSQSSRSLPVATTTSNEEVAASSTEAFRSMYSAF